MNNITTPFAISGYQMVKRHKKDEVDIKASAILKRAQEFGEAFQRCIRIENRDMLFVPAYTNLALACELCVKAIMRNENTKIASDHDLFKLFETLSEELKEIIITKHNQSFKQIMGIELRREVFLSNLKGIATTFHDYRYEYEWGTGRGMLINDAFFRCFASAIFEYAEETIKENKII